MTAEPVWIIDDDTEDQDIIKIAWEQLKLPNELVFINSAEDAYERLDQAPRAPFIIICAVNLPGMNGFALRQRLLDTHSKKFKSVPFIFWTSHITEEQITEAFELAVHGLFIKEGSFGELKDTFAAIIHYWVRSRMPAKSEKSPGNPKGA